MNKSPSQRLMKIEDSNWLQIQKRISSIHNLLSYNKIYGNYTLERNTLNKQSSYQRFHGVLQKCDNIEHSIRRIINAQQNIVQQILYFNEQAFQKLKTQLNRNTRTDKEHIQFLIKKSSQLVAKLPFVCLQVPQNQNQSVIQLQQQCLKMRAQNLSLKNKLAKCQKNYCFVQQQLFQLFNYMKISQYEDFKQSKFMKRVCDQVFSEQYMIQANFNIRNEFYNLKTNNKKLQSQLSKYRNIVKKFKKNHSTQKDHLIQIIRELENTELKASKESKKISTKNQSNTYRPLGDQPSIISFKDQGKSQSIEEKSNFKKQRVKHSPQVSQRTTLSHLNSCVSPEDDLNCNRHFLAPKQCYLKNSKSQWHLKSVSDYPYDDTKHKKIFSQSRLPKVHSQISIEASGCFKLLQETTTNEFLQSQAPKDNNKFLKIPYYKKRRQLID